MDLSTLIKYTCTKAFEANTPVLETASNTLIYD